MMLSASPEAYMIMLYTGEAVLRNTCVNGVLGEQID